jgi:hypothetical protein
MCIAAYLAIGGGFSVSLTTAAHLRSALLWLCWSVVACLVVRLSIATALQARLKSEPGSSLRKTFSFALRARAS